MVTVYWPDRTEPEAFINNGVRDNVAVAAWDTHGHHVGATPNFPMLRERNLPPLDLASSALLDDLEARGLLDETLVVCVGEFGRTPRADGGGRQHWPQCYSAVLAGGGIRGGAVYGSSDSIGAYPADRPVSPPDLTATVYHALGISPETPVHDRLGRELLLTEGRPLTELFG